MPVIVGMSIAAMIIAKMVSALGSKNGTDKLSIMNTRNESVANTLINAPTTVPMMVASNDSPRTMCSNLFCVKPMTRSVANSRLRSFAEIEKAMETAAMETIKLARNHVDVVEFLVKRLRYFFKVCAFFEIRKNRGRFAFGNEVDTFFFRCFLQDFDGPDIGKNGLVKLITHAF